ncbi:adenylate/guanylate cyclase domain-containing protein [soil metagenome]
MNASDERDIAAWLTAKGLHGATETDLMTGFCERCGAAGLDVSRAVAIIDTLHPIYEGRAFRWRNDGVEETPVVEYGSSSEGEAAENWRRSPFNHLLTSGRSELRRRIGFGDPADFPMLETLREERVIDYVAFVSRFGNSGQIGEMDSFFSHGRTLHPDGFGEAGMGALRRLVPLLGLAIKAASLTRIASTLVSVYLGRDAGRRVLGGLITRGISEKINAVLWFSDLQSYTAIADKADPQEVIPLLNDYAEAVISSVHEKGGDVLKLIGDGVLAIFTDTDPATACRAALAAEASLRDRVRDLSARREAEGRPVTAVYLGLHIGDVFYGNIGSNERLDFTVVGPAVNEVARIASMCRSADRDVLVSSAFTAATPEADRPIFVSVGRYALRGIGRPQELFTLDRET